MQRNLRLGAFVASAGMLTAGMLPALPAHAVDPTPATPASTIAATWLAQQLGDGLVKNNGTPDYGASIDAAFALNTAGNADAAQKSADAVVAAGTGYTEFNTVYADGTYVGTYGGRVAKLLALEVTVPPSTAPACTHVPPPATTPSGPTTPPAATAPRAEGVCELQDKLINSLTPAGQVQDYVVAYRSDATVPGFAIPSDPQHVTQAGQASAAYALRKLADGSGSTPDLVTKATQTLTFLTSEQSVAGGFCVEQTTTACTSPDALTTAQVILQLQQIPGTTDAVNRASAWLATQQRPDGSFGDAVVTGLAAAAIPTTYNAKLAAVWLRQNQADELAACPSLLSGSTGAVALTVQARNTGRASGIAAAALGDWERATTAAIPALNALPARTTAPVGFAGPSGFRKAGAVMTYDATNEAPGDLVCVTSSSSLSRAWADINGHASIDATMPNTTVDHVLTLHDHAGADHTVTTRVLGPKRYSLAMVSHRKRGHLFRITIIGLQSNESYYVKFRSTKIHTGRAPASGTVVVAYTIRKKAKIGKAKITVVGQTGDRNGVKYLRVTR